MESNLTFHDYFHDRMNSSNSTGLIRELWSPLVVNDIKSFTSNPSYPDNPSVYYDIDKFSTPREKGKKFGQRIRGFFTAPQNGPYMFAVSCSDECKLFLSPNDEEDKKSEIIDHPTDGYELFICLLLLSDVPIF